MNDVIRTTDGSPDLKRFHSHPAFVTTLDVWRAIQGAHGNDMKVFSSFSDPTGTFNGGPGEQGRMETTYGLPGADYPLIGARTTWRIPPDDRLGRLEETHEYFLFVAIREDV